LLFFEEDLCPFDESQEVAVEPDRTHTTLMQNRLQNQLETRRSLRMKAKAKKDQEANNLPPWPYPRGDVRTIDAILNSQRNLSSEATQPQVNIAPRDASRRDDGVFGTHRQADQQDLGDHAHADPSTTRNSSTDTGNALPPYEKAQVRHAHDKVLEMVLAEEKERWRQIVSSSGSIV